jgi:gluconate 2-dehydrogenase alpha chain
MKEHYQGALFRKAAAGLGYHPFPQPSSNLSQPYMNPEGVKMNACVFCGFCERYACEHYAKAVPQTFILPVLLANPNFSLRTGCQVQRINLDSSKKRATGVNYIDAAGNEFEQPAALVITSMFSINNVRMLLLSGIGTPYDPIAGTGVVGRNYAYQTVSSVAAFFDEDVFINPFMASGASGTLINDFAGDNFDHEGLGFIGGAFIGAVNTNGRPIQYHPVPPGTPSWGAQWKRAVVQHYNHTVMFSIHGSSVSNRANHLDLDPTYRDAWGQPLLRMTFDFPENDLRMANYVTAKAVEIGRAMGAEQVVGSPRKGPYTTTQYQTTHNTGGTVMGTDPRTSVVNRYLQSWDVPNVFVIGASNYPQNASWNPTGTLGALTYWAIDALKTQYLKNPGPLVSA